MAAVVGNLWGPQGRAGRVCPEAPSWSQNLHAGFGKTRELIGEKLVFLQIPQHNLLFLKFLSSFLSALFLSSCLQAFAPVWCLDLLCLFFLFLLFPALNWFPLGILP